MPLQNSNFKISARPDLATTLLQILIPATISSLVCQKGQFTLQQCPRRRFVRKIFGYYTPKVKSEKSSYKFCLSKHYRRFFGNYLFKRQAGQVLAKSLLPYYSEYVHSAAASSERIRWKGSWRPSALLNHTPVPIVSAIQGCPELACLALFWTLCTLLSFVMPPPIGHLSDGALKTFDWWKKESAKRSSSRN